MQTKISKAIGVKHNPVALIWSDKKPENSILFKPGRWGCIMWPYIQNQFGDNLMSFTIPLRMFREMEDNVQGSFLEQSGWKGLQT